MTKKDFIITKEEYERIEKRYKYKIDYRKERILEINGIKVYSYYIEDIFNRKFKVIGVKYHFDRTAFFVYLDYPKLDKIKKLKVCTFLKKCKEGTYSKI